MNELPKVKATRGNVDRTNKEAARGYRPPKMVAPQERPDRPEVLRPEAPCNAPNAPETPAS